MTPSLVCLKVGGTRQLSAAAVPKLAIGGSGQARAPWELDEESSGRVGEALRSGCRGLMAVNNAREDGKINFAPSRSILFTKCVHVRCDGGNVSAGYTGDIV
jgi:hypothetical protein